MTISSSTPQSDIELGALLDCISMENGAGKSFCTGSRLIIFVVQGYLVQVFKDSFEILFIFVELSFSDRRSFLVAWIQLMFLRSVHFLKKDQKNSI